MSSCYFLLYDPSPTCPAIRYWRVLVCLHAPRQRDVADSWPIPMRTVSTLSASPMGCRPRRALAPEVECSTPNGGKQWSTLLVTPRSAHHSNRFPPSKSRRQAENNIESGFAADKFRKEKRRVEMLAILVALLASMLTSFALAKLALLGVFSLIGR